MGDTKLISNHIVKAFHDMGQIASVKPLFYEGTTVCSDQWLITFETTDDPEIASRIPRTTHISNHKVTTEWKEAPKICFYCEKEGHFKKDCKELKNSIEARRLLRKARSRLEKEKRQKSETTEISFSPNNPYKT